MLALSVVQVLFTLYFLLTKTASGRSSRRLCPDSRRLRHPGSVVMLLKWPVWSNVTPAATYGLGLALGRETFKADTATACKLFGLEGRWGLPS